MGTLTRGDMLDADLIWVLALTVRGTTYYLSTESDNISGDGPGVILGGLSPIDVVIESSPTDRGIAESEVQVAFLWTVTARNSGESWANSQALGWDMGDVTGELSLYRKGASWASRQVVIEGQAIEPQYGSRDEPVEMTIARDSADDTSRLISSTMTITRETFPGPPGSATETCPEESFGFAYPFVIGYPGHRDGLDPDAPATPSPISEISIVDFDNRLVIAKALLSYGHCGTPSEASSGSVRLYIMNKRDPSTATAYLQDVAISHTYDAFGVPVTVAMIPVRTAGKPYFASDDEVYAGWQTVGGILVNGDVLQYAGDVVAYLLGRSTMRTAPVRQSVVDKLNGFKLAGYVNEQTSMWDILQADILPILPVSCVPGPLGWALVWWNLDATAADALEHIDTDTMRVQRKGMVRYSNVRQVANKITVQYRVRADSGQPTKTLTLAPQQWFDSGGNSTQSAVAYSHPLATASATRYGVRDGKAVQSPMLWDDATAVAVASWMLRRDCGTRRTVAYLCPQHLQYLRPGNVVTITDNDIGFSAEVCHVTSVQMGPGDVVIEFETLPDIIRTAPQRVT
jgi:hypothetical protein